MIRLLLGGTKSGKSAQAEALLAAGPAPRRVVATGRARDFVFRARIEAHKRARSPLVPVIEAGPEALDVLAREAAFGGTILLDSLDFWLFSWQDASRSEEPASVLARGLLPYAVSHAPEVVLVSAEIGLGPLPASAASRRFADALGTLNQAAAALAHEVRLVVAGMPLTLKRLPS
jgi:adenosylcobinamide kinase / adenosylcobinamide-phosphate guanylyltransferase